MEWMIAVAVIAAVVAGLLALNVAAIRHYDTPEGQARLRDDDGSDVLLDRPSEVAAIVTLDTSAVPHPHGGLAGPADER